VKLLLDQNVSRQPVPSLDDLGSSHVALCDLERADDDRVWEFAKAEGFTVVTKDTDFHQLALFRGPPPKVIWVRLGNCRTHAIEGLLRAPAPDIAEFEDDRESALLILP
jgi:predicted nuclease of predicted toxin-antitoxin system